MSGIKSVLTKAHATGMNKKETFKETKGFKSIIQKVIKGYKPIAPEE